jgi:hypothetical protein
MASSRARSGPRTRVGLMLDCVRTTQRNVKRCRAIERRQRLQPTPSATQEAAIALTM